MGGFTCCVPGCYNNSTSDKGLGFYVFPKEQKLRETWIQRINRAGRGGRFSKFTPTTGHRVCGAHFEGGKKTYMNRVPTIFPLRPQKVERRRPLIRTQPELPNSPTVAPQHDPEVSGSAITSSSSDSEDTAQQSTLLMDHAYSSQESSYDQLAKKVACQNNIITELAEKAEAAYAHVEELNCQLKRSQQDHAEAKKLCDRLQQKNRCLRLELSCMQKKVKRCKAEATQKIDITYEALVEDEKKLRYYTGFTSRKSFDSFWSLLEPDAKKLRFWQMKETENEDRNFILPLKTQLALVLMRLRLGLDGLDLAYRFGVSTSTVSRIWVTWLDFLDNRLRQVPTWMSPHLCDKYRPQAFTDKGYTTVDGILDCTEIFIETPSSFRVQTFAAYRADEKTRTFWNVARKVFNRAAEMSDQEKTELAPECVGIPPCSRRRFVRRDEPGDEEDFHLRGEGSSYRQERVFTAIERRRVATAACGKPTCFRRRSLKLGEWPIEDRRFPGRETSRAVERQQRWTLSE
ncbi:hypothetical protein HPB51_003780 [Rhipicephalus microplus]|uniref:THAP-type domain-containing protein n=1 Tax=Rhipicephalus microplus TaxID=6941 RepID=A0A9J6DF87_RHIMP|nr:hypothetical protein HPB51_003780 [Rhipicephalus microplus]